MPAAVKAKGENMDQSEAAYVDSQFEYLQKHKSEGVTLEEIEARACQLKLTYVFSSIEYI